MTQHSAPETRGFAHGLSPAKLFWLFVIGSFVGFVLETIWCLVTAHHFEVRVGLVLGPFIPVYGIGAVALTLALYRLRSRRELLIFFVAALAGGLVEYLSSLFQELALGTISWEYSDTPLNVGGRTNLMFSLIWGVLGLVWIKDVYPRLSGLIERIPARWGRPLTAVLAVFMVVDCLFSMSAVTRRADRAEHIPPANAYEAWIDRAFPDDYLTLIFPHMIYVDDE